jgi:hypothetical protein
MAPGLLAFLACRVCICVRSVGGLVRIDLRIGSCPVGICQLGGVLWLLAFWLFWPAEFGKCVDAAGVGLFRQAGINGWVAPSSRGRNARPSSTPIGIGNSTAARRSGRAIQWATATRTSEWRGGCGKIDRRRRPTSKVANVGDEAKRTRQQPMIDRRSNIVSAEQRRGAPQPCRADPMAERSSLDQHRPNEPVSEFLFLELDKLL